MLLVIKVVLYNGASWESLLGVIQLKKLVLFDIDGILIKSVSFGATTQVLKKYFGLEKPPNIYMEGKTHRQILFECLKAIGIVEPEKDPRFEKAIKYYGTAFRKATKNKGVLRINNVERFIKELLAKGVFIGILTGNTFGAAEAKLEKAKLLKYFKFGAYGDKTMDRSKLVPVAIKEAKKATGVSFHKENVFVIGDTVRDIWCAKANRVKSIAVSTGTETLEELKKEKPDHLFKDFKDVQALLDAIVKD